MIIIYLVQHIYVIKSRGFFYILLEILVYINEKHQMKARVL